MNIGHQPHSLEYMPLYLGDKNAFLHYTCNAPPIETLHLNFIKTFGHKFGCENDKEVLLIPESVFSERLSDLSKDLLTLKLETLLRGMEKES